jgi:hypothetical protein
MRVARATALILALAALTAAGALTALVLLSTIGGAPADDPVGRLRPVMPGLGVTDSTGSPPTTGRTDTNDTTATTDGSGTTDDERGGGDGDESQDD